MPNNNQYNWNYNLIGELIYQFIAISFISEFFIQCGINFFFRNVLFLFFGFNDFNYYTILYLKFSRSSFEFSNNKLFKLIIFSVFLSFFFFRVHKKEFINLDLGISIIIPKIFLLTENRDTSASTLNYCRQKIEGLRAFYNIASKSWLDCAIDSDWDYIFRRVSSSGVNRR